METSAVTLVGPVVLVQQRLVERGEGVGGASVVVRAGEADRRGQTGHFQHPANDVELPELLDGEQGDRVSGSRLVIDQTRADERLERLTDRDATDPEQIRGLVDRDGTTRRHLAAENGPS